MLHEAGIDSSGEIGYSYTALRIKLVTIAAKESACIPDSDTWGKQVRKDTYREDKHKGQSAESVVGTFIASTQLTGPNRSSYGAPVRSLMALARI
jgi:hypothetical protein